MNKQLVETMGKFNALSLRERVMVFASLLVVMIFLWWNFFAQPLQLKTREMNRQNHLLGSEIQTLVSTSGAIQKRIKEGVHKTKLQKLRLLQRKLADLDDELKQDTLELIGPDQMFELMQQMVFSESKLKLTGIRRKEVKPALPPASKEEGQPEIYRHVMQVKLEGRYRDILSYMEKLEKLDWKLIWDRILLQTSAHPIISVEFEISTLSTDKSWVGL